ncbi:hypothetical protein L9F63_009468, partial [Diploptera punctata]
DCGESLPRKFSTTNTKPFQASLSLRKFSTNVFETFSFLAQCFGEFDGLFITLALPT